MATVELHRIREKEQEIQRIFDAWSFDAGTARTLRTSTAEYTIVGCPTWLTPRRRGTLPKTLTARGGDARPDVVWEGDDRLFVIELKSAWKGEPIALPEVLHHAQVIERQVAGTDARVVVPVMVTQYNTWLRESLAFLFAHGLDRDALHYLEFDALHVPGPGTQADRRILWLDEPFAAWTAASPPPAVARVAGRFSGPEDRWYRIDSTNTWLATTSPVAGGTRPLFVDGTYVMVADAGPDAFVHWRGSATDVGTYHLVQGDEEIRAVRIAGPRLRHREDAADFAMVVTEEADDRA